LDKINPPFHNVKGVLVYMLSNSIKLSEQLDKTNEEPRNELQMLMELLKSGSKDEQRMLAQALLEMGQQAPNK
jgi:hypothetical protein